MISKANEEVFERISQVTKQLYRLNLVSIILCFFMWISSCYYAISMGLKHGLTFQVTTIIEGIERTSNQNTIFNLGMSGVFSWMMIAAVLSFIYLKALFNSSEGVETV